MKLIDSLRQIAEGILKENGFNPKIYMGLHLVNKHKNPFDNTINSLWKDWWTLGDVYIDGIRYELIIENTNIASKHNAAWFISAGLTQIQKL